MNPARTIGRYEILEELGRGAMGSVFKANDPAMGRTVAVKTILAAALSGTQGDEYRSRFYREARAAGSLAHPGIVSVFDVGEHEGTPFLVMEYVEGRTLAAAMRSGERFTLERSCEIGQQIAEALGHAHRKGVIHRDIKPANILMAPPEAGGNERPRIADFGLAKLTGTDLTSTGQMLGTPAFMPPEQFTGAALDGRADLFSLGVILYVLVTGEQPFHGETVTAVSYTVVHTDPVAPRKFNPGVPVQLEAAILKCLAKNPAERFQTGEELAAELAALRGGTAMASAMRKAAPSAVTATQSDATLDPGGRKNSVTQSLRPYVVPELASSAVRQSASSGGKRKIGMGTIAISAVLLLTVALIGVGLVMARHRNQAAQQASAGAAPSPAAAPVAPAADQGSAAPERTTPATGPATTAAPKPEAGTASGARTVVPRPRAIAPAIDPRTLDPKTNARLKIELSHFPPGVSFAVEMNRKVYLNAVSGDKSTFENVFVPPGVQEFRVVLKAGGQRKVSNIVSDEFKAKKRKTLKIELQGTPGPTGAPGRDAQVIVGLK
jgi:serine/threonine-protein kinase